VASVTIFAVLDIELALWPPRGGVVVGDGVIGQVKSPSGRVFEVKWDDWNKVYVKEIGGSWGASWDGPSQTASSASEAMRMAEAFVYNK